MRHQSLLLLLTFATMILSSDAFAHGSHGAEEAANDARPVQGMVAESAVQIEARLSSDETAGSRSVELAATRSYTFNDELYAIATESGLFTDPLPILAELHHEAPRNPKHRALIQLCASGERASCYLVAVMYASGRAVPRRLDLAHSLYAYSCSAGVNMACAELGGRVYFGQLMAADADAAWAYLSAACDGGVPPACHLVGMMTRDGLMAAPDGEAAAAIFSAACDEGYEASCDVDQMSYAPGRRARALPAGADDQVQLLARRCDARFERSCYQLGLALREGPNAQPELAWRLLNEACHRGVQDACDEFQNGDRYTRRDREGNPVPLPEVF